MGRDCARDRVDILEPPLTQINVAMVVIIATVVLSQNWLAGFKQWVTDKVHVGADPGTVMGQFIPGAAPSSSGAAGGGGGGGGSSPSLWNVAIIGADGTPGTIQVVSSTPGGAFEDAGQGGNTPIGPPIPA